MVIWLHDKLIHHTHNTFNVQVRIGVHCCAVNVADHLLWTGLSETKPKLPFVAGFEISGEILEVAPKAEHSADSESEDEDELRVGDRVLALNKVHLGGFSSECIVDYKVICERRFSWSLG